MMTQFLIPPLLILGFSEYLMKAPSIQNIDQMKQNYLDEKKKIHLCQQQLQKNKIPTACYQISNSPEELKQHLDKKCSEIPLESMKLHEISNLLKNQRISSQCLKVLEEKEKILRYQQQDFLIKELLKHYSI